MRKSIRCVVVLLQLCCVGVLYGQPARTMQIQDPAWGMVAAQAQVPAGWKYAAVATHPSGCALPFYDIRSTAEWRDGTIRVVGFPAVQYSHSANPQVNAAAAQGGCIVASSPAEFLSKVAAATLHPGAQDMGTHRMPGTDQQIAQMTQQDQQELNRHHHAMGSSEQAIDDVMGVLLNYTRNGRAMSSLVIGQFHCVRGLYPVAHIDTTNCLVRQMVDLTAPADQIAGVAKGIGGPVVKDSPAWEARVKQALDQTAAQQQKQMNERFAADQASLTNIHNQTMQMINGYAQSSAAINRQNEVMHEGNVKFGQSMNDRQETVNPQTGKSYDLSNQYSHTYQSTTDGTILQTNSAYSPGDAPLWTVLTPR